MIGTRGVPAQYGGFETAVENIGSHLAAAGHEIIVYSRNPGQTLTDYRRMRVVNLPALRHRTTETLSHTALSSLHAITRARPDAAFVFNAANAPVVPLLRAAGIPTAVNVDGLEARRGKWRGAAAAYFTWAEAAACRWADAIIADSRAIAAHLEHSHGIEAHYIPYGVPDHLNHNPDLLPRLGLTPGSYLLVVARLEPENQVDVIIDAYRRVNTSMPLVVVGSSPYPSPYTRHLTQMAHSDPRAHMLGAIYDDTALDTLYTNAAAYVHGHSVGGTNPSLLRALAAGIECVVFDCVFNREVLGDTGHLWQGPRDLTAALTSISERPADTMAVPTVPWTRWPDYQWFNVSAAYLRLAQTMSPLHLKMEITDHRRRRDAKVAIPQGSWGRGGRVNVNVTLVWSTDEPTVEVVSHDTHADVSIDASLSAQQVFQACAAMPVIGAEVFQAWCAIVGFDAATPAVHDINDFRDGTPPESAR